MAHLDKAIEFKLETVTVPVSVGLPLDGEAGTRLKAAQALATDIRNSRGSANSVKRTPGTCGVSIKCRSP